METTVPAYRIQRRELAWAADQEALVGWEPPTSFLAPLVPGMKAREIPGLVKDARQWFGAKGYSLALLVVDHLQLIPNGDRPESRALEVKAAANQCKETALGAGGGAPLAVLALSQLRRARDAKNPSPSDLKESGSIEEAADAVLLLARKRDCNGRLLPEGEIYIGKNRGGLAHDVVAITFNPERLWFE
jgi:replicative DNA helicase